MTENPPIIAAKTPAKAEVEEGKTYFWCRCGRSQKQPFCDGAHKGSGITPMAYKAEKTGAVFFCQCKASDKAPLCDGSHSRLNDRKIGDAAHK